MLRINKGIKSFYLKSIDKGNSIGAKGPSVKYLVSRLNSQASKKQVPFRPLRRQYSSRKIARDSTISSFNNGHIICTPPSKSRDEATEDALGLTGVLRAVRAIEERQRQGHTLCSMRSKPRNATHEHGIGYASKPREMKTKTATADSICDGFLNLSPEHNSRTKPVNDKGGVHILPPSEASTDNGKPAYYMQHRLSFEFFLYKIKSGMINSINCQYNDSIIEIFFTDKTNQKFKLELKLDSKENKSEKNKKPVLARQNSKITPKSIKEQEGQEGQLINIAKQLSKKNAVNLEEAIDVITKETSAGFDLWVEAPKDEESQDQGPKFVPQYVACTQEGLAYVGDQDPALSFFRANTSYESLTLIDKDSEDIIELVHGYLQKSTLTQDKQQAIMNFLKNLKILGLSEEYFKNPGSLRLPHLIDILLVTVDIIENSEPGDVIYAYFLLNDPQILSNDEKTKEEVAKALEIILSHQSVVHGAESERPLEPSAFSNINTVLPDGSIITTKNETQYAALILHLLKRHEEFDLSLFISLHPAYLVEDEIANGENSWRTNQDAMDKEKAPHTIWQEILRYQFENSTEKEELFEVHAQQIIAHCSYVQESLIEKYKKLKLETNKEESVKEKELKILEAKIKSYVNGIVKYKEIINNEIELERTNNPLKEVILKLTEATKPLEAIISKLEENKTLVHGTKKRKRSEDKDVNPFRESIDLPNPNPKATRTASDSNASSRTASDSNASSPSIDEVLDLYRIVPQQLKRTSTFSLN